MRDIKTTAPGTQAGARRTDPAILAVKPGIAGLWQTSGRNRLTYKERLALDLAFVRRRSPRMYAGILARCLREIWSGANTW